MRKHFHAVLVRIKFKIDLKSEQQERKILTFEVVEKQTFKKIKYHENQIKLKKNQFLTTIIKLNIFYAVSIN